MHRLRWARWANDGLSGGRRELKVDFHVYFKGDSYTMVKVKIQGPAGLID